MFVDNKFEHTFHITSGKQTNNQTNKQTKNTVSLPQLPTMHARAHKLYRFQKNHMSRIFAANFGTRRDMV